VQQEHGPRLACALCRLLIFISCVLLFEGGD
jgi:hypothetical protein